MQKEIKNSKIPLDKDKKLKIISLGGMYEIGKNTWVYECGDDIMLIDAGLAFPSVGMIGVDIVLPKLNYLVENKDKIKGLVVTHGHEDHIGGIVPLFREIDVPIIYGPNLAMGLLKGKFSEAKIPFDNIQLMNDRMTIDVGTSFSVTYIRNNHSIADSFSLIIDTPAGRVFHTGDFKIDHSPIDNLYFDVAAIARAGEDGVNLLISDSTNSEKPGYTPSEKVVMPKLKEIINNSKKRTYITTFASQVLRIKIIIDLVLKAGKKLAQKKSISEVLEIEIDPETESFYFNTYENLLTLFTNYGFTMTDARQLSNLEPLKQINTPKKSKMDFLKSYYSPSPFATAEYHQKKTVMAQIARDLGVDAVATVKLDLMKKKEKGFIASKISIGLKATIGIWDQNENVVFSPSRVLTFYSDAETDWSSLVSSALGMPDGFIDISPENQEQYDQAADSFINKLESKIQKALKKDK